MTNPNSRPLWFLATCLAFAESSLGSLAAFTDADATLVAIFALASLGMVLLSLVVMYIKDPAFLTFNSQQALDLRMIQELGDRLTPELLSAYVSSLNPQDITIGETSRIASSIETSSDEVEGVENELEVLLQELEDLIREGEAQDKTDEDR